ncbi:hypothetical protein R1sor_015434 [Riccia sorocarpa]|uniref:Reverse transcriptase domain-containing protein n=1 Tax=Riccia sorocarpa TaxID=122646 RepID=A0ABD3HFJ3_9MARC
MFFDGDSSHMTDDVATMYRALRATNQPEEGKKAIKATIPSLMVRNRLAYLHDYSFVLYTADIAPTTDTNEDWANVILQQQMNMSVTRVRALNRHVFLISVSNEGDRDDILTTSPFFLGGDHMVFVLPWKVTFNPADITTSKVPVWVELPFIHPAHEASGGMLLGKIGDIVHTTCRTEECRFAGVRGCVLLDLQEELPDHIEIEDEDTGESYFQKIVYRNLPNACFRCHQRGNIIRQCPLRRQGQHPTTVPNPEGNQQNPKGDTTAITGSDPHDLTQGGFTEVKKSKHRSGAIPNPASSNRFAALGNNLQTGGDESGDDSGTEDEETAKQTHKVDTEGVNQSPMAIGAQLPTSPGQLNTNGTQDMETDKDKEKRKREAEAKENQEAQKLNAGNQPASATAATPVVSWNVFGLGGKRRIEKVQSWLKCHGRDVGAVMLQELRIKEDLTDRRMTELGAKDNYVADFTLEGKAGAVLAILNNEWRILDQGVKGDGTVAWAKLQMEDGIIGMASVHGPRTRTERTRVWRWLKEKWEEDCWIFGGDWNAVETLEDSVGETTVQHGSERRSWQAFLTHHNLDDGWLTSSQREGPHFTRQQKVGDRLDQATLDRIYIIQQECWSDRTLKMIHDHKGRLPDHRPVILQLLKRTQTGVRKSTYLKIGPEHLNDEDTLEAMKEAWRNGGIPGEDPRRNWDWKWGKVHRIVIERNKILTREKKLMHERLEELGRQRIRVAAARSNTPDPQLEEIEEQIAKLEKQKEEEWRRFSRIRWIKEGEAPSKFFFSLLKARRAKDTITAIKTEDGRTLTKEEDIMRELYRYYSNLYKKEDLSPQAIQKLQVTLGLIKQKVTRAQNRRLTQAPTRGEIQSIIDKLPKEKAPGLDGMTSEALKKMGEPMEEDLIEVAEAIWRDNLLIWKQQQGVIKLLPKPGDKQLIKNWRPISLLNLGYKIVAKILANRLREVVPDIVDSQQKGFVKKRSINDSLLAVQIGQEWAEKSGQEVLLVKLDFEKAYDRVSHEYLWKTMEALGIDEKFILLTRGLVEGAQSKIHAMGMFSKEFPLGRGVRQGCPLAPLLFAIATQPLMEILKDRAHTGKTRGLQIRARKAMLHNLFADDSGVAIQANQEDYDELQDAIRVYELISGAKLNINKSTIIPIGMSVIPEWLRNTGCHIAAKGELIRYLGFPIGWGVSAEDQKDFVLGKLKRKLKHWSMQLLSFTGRLIAIKHVLRATPIHLFACLKLPNDTLDEMESTCRFFLWGENANKQNKIPMVAWSELAKHKAIGGLALTGFKETGEAMRLRTSMKILRKEEDWTLMAEQILKTTGKTRETRNWSTKEIMKLKCPSRIAKAPMLSGILGSWNKAKRKLSLDARTPVGHQVTPKQFLIIAEQQGWINPAQHRALTGDIRRTRIQTLGDWHRRVQYHRMVGDETPPDWIQLGQSLNVKHTAGWHLDDAEWYWQPKQNRYKGWDIPTRLCKTFTAKDQTDMRVLNKKWARDDTTRRWKRLWTKIWRSSITTKEKVWIWKIVQQGIPSLERICKWRGDPDTCRRCNDNTESLTQIFIECPKAKSKWQEIERENQATN